MATLWEKLSKANDAACAILTAVNHWDADDDIDDSLRHLFKNLEEARKQITPNVFVGKNDYAPQLMKELAPRNRNERSLNAVRYMARVNLATFTIALWTATDLPQMLSGFFSHVIPKHYEYNEKLFETFVKISSWAAYIEVKALIDHQGEGADTYEILRQYFELTADKLGVPELNEELESLIATCHDKHQWILNIEYLEDWQNEVIDAEIRRAWTSICYDIMDHFDQLYPTSNSQVSRHAETQDHDAIELRKEKSKEELEEESAEQFGEESSEEITQEVLLKEDFAEELEVQLDEEYSAEDSEEEYNKQDKTGESEAGEVEEDELDEDENEEDEEAFLTPTESLAPESTSGRRSLSAKPSSPPRGDLKRDVRDNVDSDEEDIPKIKRPRVIPANQASQTTQLSQEQAMLSSLESLDDSPVTNFRPDENAAPDNNSSTADIVQSQTTQPPAIHPFYADQTLPHGLPHTINEGPASPISDGVEKDEQGDTTYREILQSTTAERSISVGSVPKRVRRDLPFSTNAQRPNPTDRGPRALSPIEGGQVPSRNQRPGRKPYTPWSIEELDALEAGLEEFGPMWSKIKAHFPTTLSQRTNVQIKDKARTEYSARDKAGLELGIYACITPKFTPEQIRQRAARTATNRQQKQLEQSEG